MGLPLMAQPLFYHITCHYYQLASYKENIHYII